MFSPKFAPKFTCKGANLGVNLGCNLIFGMYFLFIFVQKICYLTIYLKHYEVGLMMKFDGMCCDLCRF